jgi:malonyl-CoA/methylmalonyl-CoA synthetase
MRLFISGSAPLLAETHKAWTARTNHAILERYGMTETGMNTSNPYDGTRIPGSVGFPLPGVEARICDDADVVLGDNETGNLQVRGANVMKGYWRMPEKTAAEFTADGWFRTGDIAKRDSQGYYYIVGRAKDMIISGGYNVYPKEIEAVMDKMDGVLESALVGIPHPDFGEVGVAVIIPKAGHPAPDADAVINHIKSTMANYKVPKLVVHKDSLPRNTMGKVQKNLLRDEFSDTFTTA